MGPVASIFDFRPFRRADAGLLAAWLGASGLQVPDGVRPSRAAASSTWVRRLLGDPAIECRVALERGQCVGFVRLDIGPDRRAEVTLIVDPGRQGRGIGSALLAEALRSARRRGLRQLLAVIRQSNDRALTFFGQHGFSFREQSLDGFLQLERFVHQSDEQTPLEIQT